MIVFKIILIILAVIIGFVVLLLWSTVTIDLATNGKKTIIEFRLWRFLKYTITAPNPSDEIEKDQENQEDNELKVSFLGRISNKFKKEPEDKKSDDSDELDESADDGFLSDFKKEFFDDLKALWDSEYKYFDFGALNDMIDKYSRKIDNVRYGIWRFFDHLKHKIRVTKFDLYIKFGTGQPEKTGILYGSIYSAFGALQPLFIKCFNMKTVPRLYLNPDFVHTVLAFETGIIIKTRAAHFLNAAIVGFVSYILRKRKGSVKNVSTIRQASN